MKLMDVIKPEHIDTSPGVHYFDTFDRMEREVTARWIVRFCQQRGEDWAPFKRADIEAFYNEGGYTGFWFNGLDNLEYGIVQKDPDCKYHIEDEFVRRLCKWLIE